MKEALITPDIYRRWADQTYLTFPEWFLVHAPQEQADYFAYNTSTTFPYMNHVSQLWWSYWVVYDEIKDVYEFNTWYHVMIMVIWVSSTIEYSLKSLYENVIGRITNTSSFEKMTEEDLFYAKFSKDYVDFINHTPWYEFDFQSRLVSLWTQTSFFWDNFLRKVERKYFITWELFVKTIYAKLIGFWTKSSYEAPSLDTLIIVDFLPSNIQVELPKLRVIKKYNDNWLLVAVPRYGEFTKYASILAKRWVKFKEIAWNNWDILISLLSESNYVVPQNTRKVFVQPITTKKWLDRKAILTSVWDLNEVLIDLYDDNIIVEHIYDY